MPRAIFSSLRFRLLLLVLFAVIPALGLTLYTAAEQRQLAAREVQTNALRLARLAASQQEQLIEGTRQLLIALAQLPSVRSGDSAACHAFFANLLKQYPVYANFGVIQPDGDIFCSGLPMSGPVNASQRAYFQRAMATRRFSIGDYQIGAITKKASVNFGHPVLDQTGDIQAVVFAALDLSWLNHLQADAQLPKGATLTVIDSRGTILARYPTEERWIGKSVPEAPLIKAILLYQGEGTARTLGLDGGERLYAFAPLGNNPETRMYVSIGIPTTVAFADANRMLIRNLILLGLVAVLVLAATGFFGEFFILRPAKTLVSTTRRLAAGDLRARTGLPYRTGEFGQLARAFDGMAESLERDVEERKRAEEALRESNRRLEEALTQLKAAQEQVIQQERLRALGQMASGVAHDFNNALAPILGFTEVLLAHPDYLNDQQKVLSFLQMIHTAAQDGADVVRRMREFYRSREAAEPFQPLNLNQLIEQAISLTQPKWEDQALAGGRTIRAATDLRPIPLITGNETELREVLINLIFNSVDAMPSGGTITVRTCADGECVRLEVSDTGTGMTEGVRQRCLEPFFTTKGNEGTGLGLSLVYGIVRRHEGALDIETKLGQGTTFVIRLPIQTQQKDDADTKPKIEVRVPPLHVLLVENDPLVREAMLQYLTSDGHLVETATDGCEALVKFHAGRFDLVVTDRALPEMNGDQLAIAIKRLVPDKPIILVTGSGEIMHVTGEYPRGVDLVVSKPVTLAALRQAIAQVISREVGSTKHAGLA